MGFLGKLISPLVGPVIRALAGVFIKGIQRALAEKDINEFRKNRQTLVNIQRELSQKEHLDNDQSNKIADDIGHLLKRM